NSPSPVSRLSGMRQALAKSTLRWQPPFPPFSTSFRRATRRLTMTRHLLSSALFLSLAACGGGESKDSSTTKLDAVEVQPGTISDAMIILDDSSIDGTAID